MKSPKKGTACGPVLLVPDIFVEAGEDLIMAITKIFNVIKNKVVTPSEWVDKNTLQEQRITKSVNLSSRNIFNLCSGQDAGKTASEKNRTTI